MSGWEGESAKYNSGIDVSLSRPKLFCTKWWCLHLYFKFFHPVVLYMKCLLDYHVSRRVLIEKAFRKLVETDALPVFLQRLMVAIESVPQAFRFYWSGNFSMRRSYCLVRSENQNSVLWVLLLGSDFVLEFASSNFCPVIKRWSLGL